VLTRSHPIPAREGTGKECPVAQAINGHTPSKIRSKPELRTAGAGSKRASDTARIMENPSISRKPDPSDWTDILIPLRARTSLFRASAAERYWGDKSVKNERHRPLPVAARVMAVVAIRVHPLRSLQNAPAPISHRSGPARSVRG